MNFVPGKYVLRVWFSAMNDGISESFMNF